MCGYIGKNNTAKRIKDIYIGVNGTAKKVKKAYIGVNGVAKLWYVSATVEDIDHIDLKDYWEQ